jgi:hypothetical protein
VTPVSQGDLDLPVAETAVPRLAAGLARDPRSGSRVDLALSGSVLAGLPGVTSATVTGPGDPASPGDPAGPAQPGITARVVVDPRSPAGQEPGWLERETARRVPDCRAVVVPASWQISEQPASGPERTATEGRT